MQLLPERILFAASRIVTKPNFTLPKAYQDRKKLYDSVVWN
jgi:hypothetical protein